MNALEKAVWLSQVSEAYEGHPLRESIMAVARHVVDVADDDGVADVRGSSFRISFPERRP